MILTMKLLFNLDYQTAFGEQLVLNLLGENGSVERFGMDTHDGCHWFVELSRTAKAGTYVDYYYSLNRGENVLRQEWLVQVPTGEAETRRLAHVIQQQVGLAFPLQLKGDHTVRVDGKTGNVAEGRTATGV